MRGSSPRRRGQANRVAGLILATWLAVTAPARGAPADPPKPRAAPGLPSLRGALACPVPNETLAGRGLTVECSGASAPEVAKVLLYYKSSPMALVDFEALPLKRYADGSFRGTIPAHQIRSPRLHCYFDGLDDSGRLIASNGSAEDYNIVIVSETHLESSVGPEPCVAIGYSEMVPATVESTFWIGGGAGAQDVGIAASRALFRARAGAGVSFGFQSPKARRAAREGIPPYSLWSPFEFRWGPWLAGETNFNRLLGEGGLELLLSRFTSKDRGTFTLRAGGAYGRDDAGSSRQLSFTLTGGLRSVPARAAFGGACDDSWAKPKGHAYAHGARVFVTLRVSALGGDGRGPSLLGGIEIDPSLFFPPYTRRKWINAYPD